MRTSGCDRHKFLVLQHDEDAAWGSASRGQHRGHGRRPGRPRRILRHTGSEHIDEINISTKREVCTKGCLWNEIPLQLWTANHSILFSPSYSFFFALHRRKMSVDCFLQAGDLIVSMNGQALSNSTSKVAIFLFLLFSFAIVLLWK